MRHEEALLCPLTHRASGLEAGSSRFSLLPVRDNSIYNLGCYVAARSGHRIMPAKSSPFGSSPKFTVRQQFIIFADNRATRIKT